jgi:hypothetical protein
MLPRWHFVGWTIARWIGRLAIWNHPKLLQQVNALAGKHAQLCQSLTLASPANEIVAPADRRLENVTDVLKARDRERDQGEVALRVTQDRLLTARGRIGHIGNRAHGRQGRYGVVV